MHRRSLTHRLYEAGLPELEDADIAPAEPTTTEHAQVVPEIPRYRNSLEAMQRMIFHLSAG